VFLHARKMARIRKLREGVAVQEVVVGVTGWLRADLRGDAAIPRRRAPVEASTPEIQGHQVRLRAYPVSCGAAVLLAQSGFHVRNVIDTQAWNFSQLDQCITRGAAR
jgi:hypothetical protein